MEGSGAGLAAALNTARVQTPQLAVSAHAYAAPTTQTLVDLSAVAALLVVGHLGHLGHGLGSALPELRSPVAVIHPLRRADRILLPSADRSTPRIHV